MAAEEDKPGMVEVLWPFCGDRGSLIKNIDGLCAIEVAYEEGHKQVYESLCLKMGIEPKKDDCHIF